MVKLCLDDNCYNLTKQLAKKLEFYLMPKDTSMTHQSATARALSESGRQ